MEHFSAYLFPPIKMCECLGMIAFKSESVTQDGFLKVVISKIFFLWELESDNKFILLTTTHKTSTNEPLAF